MKPTDIVSTALVDLEKDTADKKVVSQAPTAHMDYKKMMVLYLNDMLSPEIEYTINELAEWNSEDLAHFPRFFDLTARITKFLADNEFKEYSNFLDKFKTVRMKIIEILKGDTDIILKPNEEKELCLLYAKQHPIFSPLNYFNSYYSLKRDSLVKMVNMSK